MIQDRFQLRNDWAVTVVYVFVRQNILELWPHNHSEKLECSPLHTQPAERNKMADVLDLKEENEEFEVDEEGDRK